MKIRACIPVLVAMAAVFAQPAQAQGDGDVAAQKAAREELERQMSRDARRQGGYLYDRDGRRYRDGRGAGPERRFYRGDRLPPEYRGRNYVVDDWRRHRLAAPPQGYQWVQVGGDYVLVAEGTGVIRRVWLAN